MDHHQPEEEEDAGTERCQLCRSDTTKSSKFKIKKNKSVSIDETEEPWPLTQGSQSKHAVELPLLRVPDDVSGVPALLGARQQRPVEVGLTEQTEHTQLPMDLEGGGGGGGETTTAQMMLRWSQSQIFN